uniref:BLOC-1-related complex subunit 7 n=2 Tax=Meloidogyne TaxID=189290 RepID=A0A915NAP9_9BILA
MSSEDEININAIEKQFWAAKETVKVKDLEKCHSDVIKLEEGVNRALRLINRKANTNYEKINTMAKDVNLNIKTLSTQIISLSENVERLEALKSDTLGPNNSLLADSNLDETQKESINMISSHSGHVEI